MDKIKKYRNFMKSNLGGLIAIETDVEESDQRKGTKRPSLQKSHDIEAKIIELPCHKDVKLEESNILEIISNRRSHRKYTEDPLSITELSYLLWTTQGLHKVIDTDYATLRSVPSAGARHPYETYLIVNNVTELEKGLYRYLPFNNALLFIHHIEDLDTKLDRATLGQNFVSKSAIVFIWSCIPYRNEWRYHIGGHKPMILDAGHICQNLYLACESIRCGTCAIAAYNQLLMDDLIGVNGEDEFVVYLSPVGRIDV